jgi:hypothetical protein
MIRNILKSILLGLALMGTSYLPRPMTLEEIEDAFRDIHP